MAGLRPTLTPVPGGRLAHHLFTVVLDEHVDRAAFRESLAQARIQTSLHYPPVHRFSIYASGADLPVTDDYAARTVTLPMYATMTEAQQDRVLDAVRAALA